MTWPRIVSRAPSTNGVSNWKTPFLLSTNPEPDSALLHLDLAVAVEVQKAAFPPQPPVIPGLSCASFYKPARGVGGDYFDFLPLPNDAWGIAIGDVSGKGIGAALVMASLQGALRAQALQGDSDIETLITNLNRLVWKSSPRYFFVSLFYAEYEPQSRILRYVNAGHNPPIVLRRVGDGSSLITLKSEFLPVGLLQDTRYICSSFQLEVGDILVAYTDGVTDSENRAGNVFGHQRLEMILRDHGTQGPHNLLQFVLDELCVHSKDCPQADDITLVVIEVEVSEPEKSRTSKASWSSAVIDQICRLCRCLRRSSIIKAGFRLPT
jgi:phosphoserine phosphatase RsbU/P